MTISVCTLAHGRETHLANLIAGLSRSQRRPDELVIAVMQPLRYDLPEAPFPIRQIMMGTSDIPLAAARNAAAGAARGEFLIFLDVDCIPAPSLVGDYARAGNEDEGVIMGEVAYLPKGATDGGIDFPAFDRLGVTHSERPGPPPSGLRACEDYRCFWSLNFALPARDFATIGGFDERYDGYGGEDTDFGRMVVEAGLPLWWVKGAKAYHQYHPHHMPPVHHLDSVLANAMAFAEKWGEPTMQHWLRAFVLMGLIERTEHGWRKLREAEETDLALTRQQEHQPYASSAVVLDWLEANAEAA
ncbi:glycosyltransferase family 2 protein [Erythrobacter sp.]|jgi:GT2 family glycosyltransferase|uniref:glycosyltransferase family 2 protein n=1 Tax=Erythrobacter sp. TaxID=1042 RepID=UPI002EB26C15|nr:galactosyltransferase-related protein [Erythrobacter sp.]